MPQRGAGGATDRLGEGVLELRGGGRAEAGGSRRGARGLEKRGAHDPRVPAHVDGRAAPNARPRGTGEPLHRRPGELGHGSEEMVRRVYAHVGNVRHRSEVVEFRIEQHLEALKDRLGRVGFVTRNFTAERGRGENETPAPTEVEAGEQVPEWARRDSNARPLAPERRPDRQPPSAGDDSPRGEGERR